MQLKCLCPPILLRKSKSRLKNIFPLYFGQSKTELFFVFCFQAGWGNTEAMEGMSMTLYFFVYVTTVRSGDQRADLVPHRVRKQPYYGHSPEDLKATLP